MQARSTYAERLKPPPRAASERPKPDASRPEARRRFRRGHKAARKLSEEERGPRFSRCRIGRTSQSRIHHPRDVLHRQTLTIQPVRSGDPLGGHAELPIAGATAVAVEGSESLHRCAQRLRAGGIPAVRLQLRCGPVAGGQDLAAPGDHAREDSRAVGAPTWKSPRSSVVWPGKARRAARRATEHEVENLRPRLRLRLHE